MRLIRDGFRARGCLSVLLIVSHVVLAGCRVGPDHGPPSAPLLPTWKTTPGENTLGDVPSAPTMPWWHEFQDPNLDRLITLAIAENPGLHESGQRVLEARAHRGMVSSQRFPELATTGSYAYKKTSDNSSPFAVTTRNSFDLFAAGFDAAWELDLWGKYRRSLVAADAEIGVAQSDCEFMLLTLLGDVAATYVDLCTFARRIEVARQNIQVQEHTLQLATERQRAGLTKPLDVAQAESNLRATEATIPELEIGFHQAENRLCVLLGQAPRDLRTLIGEQRPIPVTAGEVSGGVPADLLRNRPDIRGAELQVVAQSERIGVAVAELYPQLSITGTISVDSTEIVNLFTSESIAHNVGPSLRWNILNFGRLCQRVKAQEARFEQTVWNYQTVVLAAVEEVENALVADSRERIRAESLEQAVEAAREAVRLGELYYSQGLANFQSVLDSQRSLLTLQDQLVVSQATVALNRIALHKSLGGGWDAVGQSRAN